MENQLVIFRLSSEDYGVDIAAVDGIFKMQDVTRIPHAPSFIEGVTSIHGRVLPVIDLRKRFGLPPAASTKDTRIVHVTVAGTKVGMLVDEVTEVLRIEEQQISPPPPITLTVDSAFITGIAQVGERLIILLDLGKVLNVEEGLKLQTFQQAYTAGEVGEGRQDEHGQGIGSG